MGFYDDEKTARQYIEMAKGYDGAELIEALHAHVPKGATVLELGMGPGVDLDILRASYTVTGSDTSQFFLDEYTARHPEADLIQLDAQQLDTDRTWNCVFSNKVLHHLDDVELANSIERQCKILNENGCIMHSFWRGTDVEEHHGLRFHNRTEDDVRAAFEKAFNILEITTYSEMDPDDSIYVIAKKK
jgi:trans-aconitate methyltransferase